MKRNGPGDVTAYRASAPRVALEEARSLLSEGLTGGAVRGQSYR